MFFLFTTTLRLSPSVFYQVIRLDVKIPQNLHMLILHNSFCFVVVPLPLSQLTDHVSDIVLGAQSRLYYHGAVCNPAELQRLSKVVATQPPLPPGSMLVEQTGARIVIASIAFLNNIAWEGEGGRCLVRQVFQHFEGNCSFLHSETK